MLAPILSLLLSNVQPVIVDRVAAIIENTVVTEHELEDRAKLALGQLDEVQDPNEREAKRKQVLHQTLEELIAERLIDTELGKVRDKLGVNDQQVDKAFDETARLNNLTMEQLTQALYNQGMTVSEFKNNLRKQLERSQYLQFRMQGKSGFTDKDVLTRCNELRSKNGADVKVRARHVLIKLAPDAKPEEVTAAKKKIDTLHERLVKGEDFATLADKESDDKGTPGGDLGYFGHGDMVGTFESVAFSAKLGDISKPVRTRFGFHIIRVEDKQQQQSAGCDDEQTKAKVAQELYNREMEHQLKVWVEELRKKSYVDVKI